MPIVCVECLGVVPVVLGWARWHESRRLVSLSVMPCTGRAGLSGPERDGWCVSMIRASTIRAGQHDPDCGGWGKCLGGCRVCRAEFRVGLAGWVEWRAVGVSECLGMSRGLGRTVPRHGGWRSANVCDACVVVVCGVCGGAQ